MNAQDSQMGMDGMNTAKGDLLLVVLVGTRFLALVYHNTTTRPSETEMTMTMTRREVRDDRDEVRVRGEI